MLIHLKAEPFSFFKKLTKLPINFPTIFLDRYDYNISIKKVVFTCDSLKTFPFRISSSITDKSLVNPDQTIFFWNTSKRITFQYLL